MFASFSILLKASEKNIQVKINVLWKSEYVHTRAGLFICQINTSVTIEKKQIIVENWKLLNILPSVRDISKYLK